MEHVSTSIMIEENLERHNIKHMIQFTSKNIESTINESGNLISKVESYSKNLQYEDIDSSKLNYFAKKRINLYKTEMCRSYEETGTCKYGDRCQFAHQRNELRHIVRHPRYKTETCKTFWEIGTCPYGKRCCFVHLENKDLVIDSSDSEITQTHADKINEEKNIVDVLKNQDENDLLVNIPYKKGIKNMFLHVEDEIESDESFLSEIKMNMKDDDDLDRKKEAVKSIFMKQEDIIEEDINIQEMRPFWSQNQANIWTEMDHTFCYIKKHRKIDAKAVGTPKINTYHTKTHPSSKLTEFVCKNLGL